MKAVIVDLDQTLLRTDKTLSGYSVGILQKCHDKGIAVLAATARPERSILQYQQLLRFDAVTTMNGARIVLPEAIIENGIAHASAKSILSRLMEIPNVLISVETSEGIYSSAPIPAWNSRCYGGFPDLPTQGTVFKLLASSPDAALFHQVAGALTEDVYYTVANGELVQIMSKGATKWNGIRAMLNALHISRSDACYFGDDNDDIEPIKMCGVGVAVSNAIEAVLRAADHITGSNDEDGVAHFIETHLL